MAWLSKEEIHQRFAGQGQDKNQLFMEAGNAKRDQSQEEIGKTVRLISSWSTDEVRRQWRFDSRERKKSRNTIVPKMSQERTQKLNHNDPKVEITASTTKEIHHSMSDYGSLRYERQRGVSRTNETSWSTRISQTNKITKKRPRLDPKSESSATERSRMAAERER